MYSGVILLDLQDALVEQQELAFDEGPPDRSALMETVDRLNERYGRGSIALASTGKSNGQRTWTMKKRRLCGGFALSTSGLPSRSCHEGIARRRRTTRAERMTTRRAKATLIYRKTKTCKRRHVPRPK